MALRGTLKDFGIADVFQLIGHQGKSGKLTVTNRDEAVEVYFYEGNVVRATPHSRKRKDLLGSMLVRAEAITDTELKNALARQQQDKRRLGEILLDTTHLDPDTLQTFFKLQTTETLYRLFVLDSGSYEFTNQEVPPPDDPRQLIRSEQVLMEGFRQVDDWPEIRKKISGYQLIFERKEDLEALAAQEAASGAAHDDDPFADLDLALSDLDGGGGTGTGRLRNIGDNERLVYALIAPERDVQKIIDLSRLGEFDTCKALCNLIDAAIVAPAAESPERRKPSADATVGGITSGTQPRLRQALGAGAVVMVLLLAYALTNLVGLGTSNLWARVPQGYVSRDVQEVLSRAQLARLREALAIYASEQGRFPASLEELVTTGLVSEEDLRFPWHQPYHYGPQGDGYVLKRPLF